MITQRPLATDLIFQAVVLAQVVQLMQPLPLLFFLVAALNLFLKFTLLLLLLIKLLQLLDYKKFKIYRLGSVALKSFHILPALQVVIVELLLLLAVDLVDQVEYLSLYLFILTRHKVLQLPHLPPLLFSFGFGVAAVFINSRHLRPILQ